MIEYDIESYPNIFTFTSHDETHRRFQQFEISWRRNDYGNLILYLQWIAANKIPMVGFNNVGYDYPIIHSMFHDELGHYQSAYGIYSLNQSIIDAPWEDRFKHRVPAWKMFTPQIDLYLMHHFDNDAKRTSLKQLEFVMRYGNIEDLPYQPGIPIPETSGAANLILDYNKHDVAATYDFRLHSMKAIEFRRSMSEKYDHDFTNYNDTKIGKQYFIMCLNSAGIQTHNDRQPIQTPRDRIHLGDLVLPYVVFERHEFQHVLQQIRDTSVTETKGALSLTAELDGFEFVFGLGGIHGSIEGQAVHSDDEYIVIDADVASYYPNIAIKNNIYPEHLSSEFCKVYEDVYNQRKSYAKGTVENAAMKLALNGVYGDSNSKYSPFYDPNYTMAITINGQLMLCMLSEQLMKIPNLTMIQINTDGLTVKFPRTYLDHYYKVCEWWQMLTKLDLEFVEYKSMYIRDVNNYIAVGVDGKTKFKGAYVHTGAHEGGELDWHKNHNALVVKKAVAAAILEDKPVAEFIRNHTDPFDFMLVAKVGRKDSLELQEDITWSGDIVFRDATVENLQRISRYYMSTTGKKLIKKMPPLKRRGKKVDMIYPNWQGKKISGVNKHLTVQTEHEFNNALMAGYKVADGGTFTHTPVRQINVENGYRANITNRFDGVMPDDLDFNYYITQAEKLVNAIIKVK